MNILVNAYACSPNMGSEPGMAWNWCVNLAKHCELFIITEEEFRDKIEAILPTLSQGKNMHFYFNAVTPKVRKMCWNQGDWRFYWHYRKWQKRTLTIAKEICNREKIDILHQLNMIGYREPGLLWKIEGPKFVWGPIGGLGEMPKDYLEGVGIKNYLFNRIKNIINSLQYKYQPNVRNAVKRADALIAATSGSQCKLQNYYHKQVYLINETGCEVLEKVERATNNVSTLNMLWVGKLDFRKQLPLAIKVLSLLKDVDVRLHVCGSGTKKQIAEMFELVSDLEIREKLKYYGEVTHAEVLKLMKVSDLFLFTSVAEGTPHVVQEAISNHLPVICFDTCGQGDCVSSDIGVKVPLSNPTQSVDEMSTIIRELYNNRKRLTIMSNNCLGASKKMSWNVKVKMMLEIYEKITQTADISYSN